MEKNIVIVVVYYKFVKMYNAKMAYFVKNAKFVMFILLNVQNVNHKF